jgi:hypothetical protein
MIWASPLYQLYVYNASSGRFQLGTWNSSSFLFCLLGPTTLGGGTIIIPSILAVVLALNCMACAQLLDIRL